MSESMDEQRMRYEQAMHAIQTGVAYEQTHGSVDGTPKHLRVGIASGQIAQAALVSLLIEKGVITLEEYVAANTQEALKMVLEYEERINKGFDGPGKVNLV